MVGLTKKVVIGKRLGEGEGFSHVNIWGKKIGAEEIPSS